ncbi:MAG: energy transducer TonB [Bacteroidota bacterium]
MPKSILLLLLCVLPFIGLSQSARKTNKLLKLEYTSELNTYDSLHREDAVLFEAGQKKYREIETAAKPIRGMLREVGGMQRVWSQLSYDLSLLEIPHSPNTYLEKECKALDVMLTDVAQKLTIVSKEHVLYEKKDFLAVFPGKGSVKKQNLWFTEMITEVREKQQSLQALNKQLRLVNTAFDLSYKAMTVISENLDSMEVIFEKEIKSFKEQKEQARSNYVLKGPKGFNENYAKVFRDAFAPKFAENETVNIQAGYNDGWPPEAMPPPVKAPVDDEKHVYTYVEEPAEFPGGISKLREFIKTSLKYPEEALAMQLEGKCYLQFVVDTLGKIRNVQVKRGVPDCPECDKEAIRMAESMPDWSPGKNNGKPVSSTFNLPVAFKLPE